MNIKTHKDFRVYSLHKFPKSYFDVFTFRVYSFYCLYENTLIIIWWCTRLFSVALIVNMVSCQKQKQNHLWWRQRRSQVDSPLSSSLEEAAVLQDREGREDTSLTPTASSVGVQHRMGQGRAGQNYHFNRSLKYRGVGHDSITAAPYSFFEDFQLKFW